MAQAAKARGIKLLAISDHSFSLGVAGGMTVEDVRRQRQEIDEAQRQLGDSIRLIQGAEVEMRADGSLDFPDEVLAELDIVCASLHTGLRQPREKVTERTLSAIRNPHVDMIGHPTGRMIPDREGADLDMDAVLAAAAETDTVLEINAHPSRLDLDDVYARRAIGMGIKLAINTDAHAASDLDLLHFGVSTARRGWVTAESVINTWQPERLLAWLKDRD
jgi:DNA polymerase (family 10)